MIYERQSQVSKKYNKLKSIKELQATINISNSNLQANRCAILAESNAKKANNGNKPIAKAIQMIFLKSNSLYAGIALPKWIYSSFPGTECGLY